MSRDWFRDNYEPPTDWPGWTGVHEGPDHTTVTDETDQTTDREEQP